MTGSVFRTVPNVPRAGSGAADEDKSTISDSFQSASLCCFWGFSALGTGTSQSESLPFASSVAMGSAKGEARSISNPSAEPSRLDPISPAGFKLSPGCCSDVCSLPCTKLVTVTEASAFSSAADRFASGWGMESFSLLVLFPSLLFLTSVTLSPCSASTVVGTSSLARDGCSSNTLS